MESRVDMAAAVAPAIIFFDEIDALGRSRSGLGRSASALRGGINQLLARQVLPVDLGPHVLRTETAAVAGLLALRFDALTLFGERINEAGGAIGRLLAAAGEALWMGVYPVPVAPPPSLDRDVDHDNDGSRH